MVCKFALLAFFSIVSLGLGQPGDCFVPGKCLSGVHVGGNQVEKKLFKNRDESSWHMTIGGHNGSSALSSVELYNWQTGQQCYIESLPEALYWHSGTLMNGNPVVCGGFDSVGCFHYQTSTKKWEKISDLLDKTNSASSVSIPGQGWFLFGGNDLNTAQKLMTVDSKWEKGPEVQKIGIFHQCAIQIGENVTAFLGGSSPGNRKNISIYDWSSQNPSFVLQSEMLTKDRFGSTCGLIRREDDELVVAIIGGYERGMELWNPKTHTVELLWDEIPPENGLKGGLLWSELVTIKGGTEFILYGGRDWDTYSTQDGIWKYIVSENSWTRIDSLLTPRDRFVTLPVSGIECP